MVISTKLFLHGVYLSCWSTCKSTEISSWRSWITFSMMCMLISSIEWKSTLMISGNPHSMHSNWVRYMHSLTIHAYIQWWAFLYRKYLYTHADLAREGSVLSVQLQKQLNEEEKHGEQSLQNNISEKVHNRICIWALIIHNCRAEAC